MNFKGEGDIDSSVSPFLFIFVPDFEYNWL